MQFTSLIFLGFFIIFYLLYLAFNKYLRVQNFWLLVASYVFYYLIGWRFLLVLIFITIGDFSIGWLIGYLDRGSTKSERLRKLLIFSSLVIDIGLLAFFKYFGYFTDSFTRILDTLNLHPDPSTLYFLLPIGISFYALKSMSYTLDVYRKKQLPSSNLVEYAIYLAFFPTLLAGPIDRAGKLLAQIQKKRNITPGQISAGIYLILWGYFKKLVIADNLAVITNQVFESGSNTYGLDILLGILAFSIQIYADFSAYTDIARGLARLMGFDLAINFKLPYFAINPADFWQRWHISLSEWLRDYIFFPIRRLILSNQMKWTEVLGLVLPPLVTMLASGWWHGIGETFIFWGLYHGVLLIAYRVFAMIPISVKINQYLNSSIGNIMKMGIMFGFTSLGWLFFRAGSLEQAFQMLGDISLVSTAQSSIFIKDILFYSSPLILVQLWQAVKGDLLVVTKQRLSLQVLVHSFLLVWLFIFGARQATEFIYSQF